jgi:hypothetical protein
MGRVTTHVTTSDDIARAATHHALSTALALYSDRELRAMIDAAPAFAPSIGGKTAVLDIDGSPVFVKTVPLSDPEREPANSRSTANVFGLPTYCQYGLAPSPGAVAWRELAVHTMTTDWVLAGDCAGFPLTHHWRVLPETDLVVPDELADVDKVVAFWGGDAHGPQVRRRIEARATATAGITLFLEYLPQNLHQWLSAQLALGEEAAEAALTMVERELAAGIAFMNGRGLLHFDAHLQNIMTDGHRLFFADYGLAICDRFELSPDEVEFFRRHESYDRMYTAWFLVIWLVTELYGYTGADRTAFIRAVAEGERPTGIPPTAAAILTRNAGYAVVMGEFADAIHSGAVRTPYPF